MGGNDEEWMLWKGPEKMEDQGEGEMLYWPRTNWSWRHDYQYCIPLFHLTSA